MYNILGFQNFASTYSLSGLNSLGSTGLNGATGYSPMIYGSQNYWANNILYPLSVNDTNYHLIASWDQITSVNYSNGIYVNGQIGSWRDLDNKTPISLEFSLVWDGTKPYLNGSWDGKEINNNYVSFIFTTSGSLAYLYMKLNNTFCSFSYTITGGDSIGVITLQTPIVGNVGTISYNGTTYENNDVGITDWTGSGGNILNVLANPTNVWGSLNTDGIITSRLDVSGTGTFNYITTNKLQGGTGTFNNLLSDYLYGTNVDVGNNLLVSSYLDNRTGTGLFGPIVTTSITNSNNLLTNSLNVSGTGTFNYITTNKLQGGTGTFNNLLSDYLYGTNVDVGNNLLVSSYLDNRTGTGLFGPIVTTSITNSGPMTIGALTTTSITNSGNLSTASLSSGTSTFAGTINAGSNYIVTTGTGSFGNLSCSGVSSLGNLNCITLSSTNINNTGILTVGGTGTFNNGINLGSVKLSTSGILLDTNAQIYARYGVLSLGESIITSYNPNINLTNTYGSSIYALPVISGIYSNDCTAGDTVIISNNNNLLLKSGNNNSTSSAIRINTSNDVYFSNSQYTTGTGSFGHLACTSINTVSSTTLSYLDATSSIQTQLNSKLNLTGGTINGDLIVSGTGTIKVTSLSTNKALISDSLSNITTSGTTATELGYLTGCSSNVQSQLNSKQATISGLISTSCWANTYTYNVYGAMANAYTFTINTFSQIANWENSVYAAYRPNNISLYTSFGLNGYTINYSAGYPQYYQIELSARTNDYSSSSGAFGIALYTDTSNLLIGSMTKQRECWGSIDNSGRTNCYFTQLLYLNSQTTYITFAMFCTQSNRYVIDYNIKITPIG